jgi:hypothetical protein
MTGAERFLQSVRGDIGGVRGFGPILEIGSNGVRANRKSISVVDLSVHASVDVSHIAGSAPGLPK